MLASRGSDAANSASTTSRVDARMPRSPSTARHRRLVSRRARAQRVWLAIASAACACGVYAGQPAIARAEFTLAGDLDVQAPVSIDSLGTGGGFGIRIGSQLTTSTLVITPEIGFTYATFSKSLPPQVYRGIMGLRLGFGEDVRFGVLGHFGLARVSWDRGHSRDFADSGWGYDFTHTGFTYDAGVFFEFSAAPGFDLGLHGIYNGVADDYRRQPDPLCWLQIGVHMTLVL